VTAATAPAPVATTTGPLRRVLLALEAGVASRAALARHTGLDRDVVDAAVAHLVRLGRVRAETLGSGCPSDGCGRCPSGRSDGLPGCLAGGPAVSRGLKAVTLVPRQPE